MSSFAQIENIPISKDSTIMIDKLYAGILSGGQFSIDSMYNNKFVSTRVGVMGTWQMTKWAALRSSAIYHLQKDNTFDAEQFWAKFEPIKGLRIETGYTATLSTEQRPAMVTAGNQFETFTEAQGAGMTYNVKVAADITSKVAFGGCVAYRNKKAEYQAMVKYGWLKISGWYDAYNKKTGSMMNIDLPHVYNVTSWRQDQIVANFICVKLGKNKDYQIYSDNGYNLLSKKVVRSETGFLKTFQSCTFCAGGLFGLGYKYETRSVNGYLWLYLDKRCPKTKPSFTQK